MNTYDFVHLVFHAAKGKIQGRTKLQKMVYFAGALTGMLEELGYAPHYYGPYSSAVAGAVNELRGLRFLEQRVEAMAVDPQGFEMTRYDYSLTPDGETVAKEKVKEHADEWAMIRDAMSKLEKAKVKDYVKLSIAAKAHFLVRQKKRPATIEELVGMTPQFKWKVSEEQMREAASLLENIGLISRKK